MASVNIILYISFIYFITLKIIKTKNFNFNFIAVILLTSFLLIKFARYREYGNDIIPLIVSIYFLIQILELKKNKIFSQNEMLNFSIPFVAFMFAHKISYIFAFLMFLPLYKNLEIIKKIKINSLFIFLLIFIPWVIKNFITTSCIAYPIEFTCFSNSLFELQGVAQPSNASWLTEIWAKGFIDHPNWENINLDKYISGFNWLPTWLNGHFIKILEITSPLFFMILLFSLFLLFNKKKYLSKKKNQKNNYFLIWFGIFIGLSIWFYKAPIFRYGSFYIISLIVITYIAVLNYFFSQKNLGDLKFFKFIFIICLFFFVTKNLVRINNSDLQLFPKTVFNENKRKFNIINGNELKLLSVESGLCYYTQSICSHEIPKNIKAKKLKNDYILME